MNESRHLFEEGVGSVRRPPGERLRQARERQGMDVAEVAGMLRLSSAMIEALEQDRYGELPPPAFVRGYLRSYAELLHLPADEVLRAYALVQPEPGPVTRAGPVGQPLSGSNRARVVASVLGVVILALALVVVGWFSAEREVSAPEVAEAPEESSSGIAPGQQTETAPDLGQPVTPVFRDEQADEPAAETEAGDKLAAGEQLTEHEAVIEPRAPGEGTDAPEQDEAPEPRAAAEPPQVQPSPAAPDEAVTEASPEPQQSPATAAGITPVLMELRIREGGQSWVEIEDAAGEQVARRLFGSGERFRARVAAPLSVFLGNAAEVELRIDGEARDLQPHIRANDTARMIIEAKAP